MYYLSDINQASFARKKGSKDKVKRRVKISLAVAAGLALTGLAAWKGKHLLKRGKSAAPQSTNTVNTNKPIIFKPKESSLKQQQNSAKVQRRLRAIRSEFPAENLMDSINVGVKPKDRMVIGVTNATQKSNIKKAVNKLRAKKAYYSIGDVVEFGRPKGSKDKKKRKVGLFDTSQPAVVGQKRYTGGPVKGQYMSTAGGLTRLGIGAGLAGTLGGALGSTSAAWGKSPTVMKVVTRGLGGVAAGTLLGGAAVYSEHRNSKYSSLYKGKRR